VSVWLWFSRCCDNPYIISTKRDLSFNIFVSKFEGWKGRYFYGRPRAALGLATPLGSRSGSLRKALRSVAEGRLLLAVKSLYSSSEVCVRVGRIKSWPFTVGVWLRQGCVLSRLFFIVYISGSQPFRWRSQIQTYGFVGEPH